MQPESLCQLLTGEFALLGVGGQQPITHSPIHNNGYFVGYLFRCDTLRAVWFVSSGIVKFYGPDRTLLRKIKPCESSRKAA